METFLLITTGLIARPESTTVSTYMIEVPAKKWHPKPTTDYHMPDEDCLPDSFFIHEDLGHSIVNDNLETLPPRDDLILWDEAKHRPFFDKLLVIGDSCPAELREELMQILERLIDAFCPSGTSRNVRGIKFHIDTGNTQPVCVPQPKYGLYERKIMQDQIDILLKNGMIKENFCPWACKIVLAAKPHQEHVTELPDYKWRMCVNFQPINRVTRAFKFLIPRCSKELQLFDDSRGTWFAASVDADSGV